jgi:spermidine synthase
MNSLPPGVADARLMPDGRAEGAGPLRPGLASALVFLASGAVLVLETVSLRLVGPYVGVTLQVTSAVIGVALAAIAYGAWLGGWVADRRDPAGLIAPMLVLAGITTAMTLPLVRYSGELLRGGAISGILLLTALAIFLPAALLAAVTPLVVKLQLGDLRRTGQVVGRLSSVGTLGGITATLVTGFVLVAALSTTVIVLGLSVLLGLAGLALGWHLRRPDHTRLPRAIRIKAGAAVLLGLAAASLSTVAPSPCDVETAYHCATVETDPHNPNGRILLLNSAQHSYVDLVNPTHLEYGYTQWISAVADVMSPSGRLDAVHLGGGGFTIPRYLSATRPGTDNVVYEIDGRLVELGERKLDIRPGPGLRPVVGDARMLVGQRDSGSADLVVGDAFGDLVVPWHLATREMAAEIRRIVRPGGIYVQNVIDHPPARFVRSELATVASEFDHVALIAPPAAISGEQGANFIIVASPAPLPLDAVRARLTVVSREPVTMLSGAALDAFVDGALVLTDDYAPVDQLLATA